MSLVSDALRKARQEAARRDAERRGQPLILPPAGMARPSASGRSLALGVALGLVAALAGGTAAWWLAQRAGAPDAGPSSAAVAPPVAASSATVTGLTNLSDAEPVEDDPGQPARTSSMPQPTALPAADAPDVALPPTERTQLTTPPDTGAGNAAEAADAAGPGPSGRAGHDDLVFDVDADLGDVHLSVDYLVIRPDDPFAQINGQEVRVGSTIEGYEIVAIERDRVVLDGPLGTVTINVP